MTNDAREQQLWELEYGLLSGEEAAALRAQLAADPELAQRYARVRRQVEWVAAAGKLEVAPIELTPPADGAGASPIAPPPASRRSRHSPVIRRLAAAMLTISALLLVGAWGWATVGQPPRESPSLVYDRRSETAADGLGRDTAPASGRASPGSAAEGHPARASGHFLEERKRMLGLQEGGESEALLAKQAEPLRVYVSTPPRLHGEAKTPIAVTTTAPDGTPQSVNLQLDLEQPVGQKLFSQGIQTDQRGQAVVELPQINVDRAQLRLARANGNEELQVELNRAQTEFATQISLSKPLYRPGEMVRYRTVTLTRFGLQPAPATRVEYRITDPAGQEVAGSRLSGTTESGVGNGEFALPDGAVAGQYTLIARSPEGRFPEVRRPFTVLATSARAYDVEVEWREAPFAGGSTAAARLAVKHPNGEFAKDVPLQVRAYVDGKQVVPEREEVQTDAAGKTEVEFALPPQLASSHGSLGIQAGNQDVIWRTIPLQADQVQVDFYPEGGELAPGVENRVYFHCHDFDGEPVSVRGKVFDDQQQAVAEVATQVEGRGTFRFTPDASRRYTLQVEDPPSVTTRPVLPPVRESNRLTLDAGPGVFEADRPLQLTLRADPPPREFSLVAHCRGVTVGQHAGTAADFSGVHCEVALPVVEEAAGVIRVTAFDYTQQPPEPLAERLVYRQPKQKLQVQVNGIEPTYSAGAVVHGEVQVTDERGAPVSAVLGLAAIDETVLQRVEHVPPTLPTQVLLLGEIARGEELEDANFYLTPEPQAAVALDLLLGTQGWRRFERVPATALAGGSVEPLGGLAYGGTAGMGGLEGPGVSLYAAPHDGVERLATGLEAGAWSTVVPEAPVRFDNYQEKLSESLSGVPADPKPSSIATDTRRGSSQHPSPRRGRSVATPSAVTWVVPVSFGLGMVMLLSAVVYWHPTRRTLLAGVAGACCVVLVATGWMVAGRDSGSRHLAEGVESVAPSASAPVGSDFATDGFEFDPAAPRGEPDAASDFVGELAVPAATDPAPAGSESAASSRSAAAPEASSVPPPAAGQGSDFRLEPGQIERRAMSPPRATPQDQPLSAGMSPSSQAAPPRPAAPPPNPASANSASANSASANPAPSDPAPSDPAPANPARAAAPQPADSFGRQQRGGSTREGDAGPVPGANMPGGLGPGDLGLRPGEPMPGRAGKYPGRSLTDFGASQSDGKESGRGKRDAEARRELAPSSLPPLRSQAPLDAAPLGDRMASSIPPAPASSEPTQALPDGSARFLIRRYAHVRPKPQRGEQPDYTESVLWEPLVRTDDQGRAKFRFELPETATRFHLQTDAHGPGRVGAAVQSVQAVRADD